MKGVGDTSHILNRESKARNIVTLAVNNIGDLIAGGIGVVCVK